MFDIEYQFNFCADLTKTCNGVSGSAIEFLDIYNQQTDTCEILGMQSQSLFHLIDDASPNNGIVVAYLGGALCEGSETRSLNG